MTFGNRELSWLNFNARILQEAHDTGVPLLQRLRFLGIFSNNQDEFIRVHLANIVRANSVKSGRKKDGTVDAVSAETAAGLLASVNCRVAELQREFERIYVEVITEMESNNIYIVNECQLDECQRRYCRDYFTAVVAQRLVPLILKKNVAMPFLKDNSVYLAVKMITAKGNNRYAIVQIPVGESCPRFVVLPSGDGTTSVIFLDDVIRLCLDEIFFMFNYRDISAYTFVALRDAYFSFDDDISKSLLEKMNSGIHGRLHGQPVKLIYDGEMPADMLDFISSKFKLKNGDNLSAGGRYHHASDLMKFPRLRPDLEDVDLTPMLSPDIQPFSSIFKVVDSKDVMLNYPYQTFTHFVDFLKEAAIDPKVDSIYITLYRLAGNSKVVNALINAAKNGKTVVAVVELFARFEEEQNTFYSELLQKEGVVVVHGSRATKIHCKIALVNRKTKGYVYVGTGNFNETTAQLYSDFGVFTSNAGVVKDARAVFDFLQNLPIRLHTRHLTLSPYYMRHRFEELIKREIKHARDGKPASVCGKFNSLTDKRMIRLLHSASRQGVDVRLIVRSACCLNLSPDDRNISIVSIVDRFLEHSRMMIFHNDGDEQIFVMSADLMPRNLDFRVEVCLEISDESIKNTLKDVFRIQWSDNVKARNQANEYVNRECSEPCRSQTALYEYYSNRIRARS
jgi:polyphosphate kinase